MCINPQKLHGIDQSNQGKSDDSQNHATADQNQNLRESVLEQNTGTDISDITKQSQLKEGAHSTADHSVSDIGTAISDRPATVSDMPDTVVVSMPDTQTPNSAVGDPVRHTEVPDIPAPSTSKQLAQSRNAISHNNVAAATDIPIEDAVQINSRQNTYSDRHLATDHVVSVHHTDTQHTISHNAAHDPHSHNEADADAALKGITDTTDIVPADTLIPDTSDTAAPLIAYYT